MPSFPSPSVTQHPQRPNLDQVASWNALNGYGQAPSGYAPGPMSPQSSSQGANGVRRGPSVDESQAKRNPLDDLVETEKVYVEQLTLVIRRVAAAWSRRNLPPPKLDAMFRCIEAVYRANRAFAVRLKDIAANPANAKALGDLLMRWIDDLEPSYGRYGTIYLAGFDSYLPVSGNPALAPILDEVTISCPPSPPVERWTLDALFILPYTRLRYYRKLYTRLLKNTQEGRSDHRLLANANERLETLIADVERRLELDVSEEDPATANAARGAAVEQTWPNEKLQLESRNSGGNGSSADTHSQTSSSFTSRKESSRTSATSAPPSAAASPGRPPPLTVTTADSPVTDLELRIDAERTIDLFSMQPRKCKLQMNPPGLAYTRSIRSSHDATVFFTPSSTGQQVVHRRAHIFILTDLFLITDRMEASEKAAKAQQVAREQPERVGERGPMPEMWLAYPPLAGKHLVVVEGQQSNVLAVTVMRKETFVIHANSEIERDQMVKSIQECIDFASGKSRTAPPTPVMPSPVSHTPPMVNTPPMPPADGGRPLPRIDTNPPARYPTPMSPVSNSSHGHYDASLTGHMQNMSLNQGDWTNPNSSGPPPRGASLRGRGENTLSPGQLMSQPTSPMVPENRAISTRSAQSSYSTVSALSTQSMPPNMNRPPPQPMYGQQGPYTPQPQGYGDMPPPPVPKGPAGPSYNDYAAPMPRGAGGPQGMRLRDDLPPIPQIRANGSHLSDVGAPSGYPEHFQHAPPIRSRSAEAFRAPEAVQPPSARMGTFHEVTVPPHQQQQQYQQQNQQYPDDDDDTPPASPTEEVITALTGPTTITAQMKCKVFLNNGHQQWKSLGSAKLKLFVEQGRNVKQLVVESNKKVLISTIVLTDGVERVGRTGVAIELSTNGQRSGHVYMIQLRNDASADGLHESLLAGSDRARNH
ncbi:hypothetical protein Q8F55_003908 [Vanrija albida]|uniref:DH domain-containing protein n=1 Tax=Vanrija albida TaxID=181172 RepID=A0ABR3Q598_9TREE